MAINAKEIIASLPESRQERIRAMAGRILDREYSSPGECLEFEFTLILEGISRLTPELTVALDDAGCADALLSEKDGVVSAAFLRAARTQKDAVFHAISDIRNAGIGARVRLDSKGVEQGIHQNVNGVLNAVNIIEMDPTYRPYLTALLANQPR
jgi:hypothetical protein